MEAVTETECTPFTLYTSKLTLYTYGQHRIYDIEASSERNLPSLLDRFQSASTKRKRYATTIIYKP